MNRGIAHVTVIIVVILASASAIYSLNHKEKLGDTFYAYFTPKETLETEDLSINELNKVKTPIKNELTKREFSEEEINDLIKKHLVGRSIGYQFVLEEAVVDLISDKAVVNAKAKDGTELYLELSLTKSGQGINVRKIELKKEGNLFKFRAKAIKVALESYGPKIAKEKVENLEYAIIEDNKLIVYFSD